MDGSCCLIDPVTGAASHLPKTVLKLLPDVREYYYSSSNGWDSDDEGTECCAFVVGRVDSTGECKVFRLVCAPYMSMVNFAEHHPVSSVLTINGGDCAQWRATQNHPEFPVNMHYMDRGVLVGTTVSLLLEFESRNPWC